MLCMHVYVCVHVRWCVYISWRIMQHPVLHFFMSLSLNHIYFLPENLLHGRHDSELESNLSVHSSLNADFNTCIRLIIQRKIGCGTACTWAPTHPSLYGNHCTLNTACPLTQGGTNHKGMRKSQTCMHIRLWFVLIYFFASACGFGTWNSSSRPRRKEW